MTLTDNTEWPDIHTEFLKKLVEAGHSAREAAEMFWQHFRITRSRNSCLAKAKRIGLTFHSDPRRNPGGAMSRTTQPRYSNGEFVKMRGKRVKKPKAYDEPGKIIEPSAIITPIAPVMNGSQQKGIIHGFHNKRKPDDVPPDQVFQKYAEDLANAVTSVPAPKSKPVPLLELKDKGCRWPVGDLFCNEEYKGRGPYCTFHNAVK